MQNGGRGRPGWSLCAHKCGNLSVVYVLGRERIAMFRASEHNKKQGYFTMRKFGLEVGFFTGGGGSSSSLSSGSKIMPLPFSLA